MTTKTIELVLLCNSCRQPVVGRDGYVLVDRDEARCRQTVAEWLVYHRACDPHDYGDYFWFSAHRAGTAADLLAQTAHLFREDWIAGTNLDDFIHRVLRDSGWERP